MSSARTKEALIASRTNSNTSLNSSSSDSSSSGSGSSSSSRRNNNNNNNNSNQSNNKTSGNPLSSFNFFKPTALLLIALGSFFIILPFILPSSLSSSSTSSLSSSIISSTLRHELPSSHLSIFSSSQSPSSPFNIFRSSSHSGSTRPDPQSSFYAFSILSSLQSPLSSLKSLNLSKTSSSASSFFSQTYSSLKSLYENYILHKSSSSSSSSSSSPNSNQVLSLLKKYESSGNNGYRLSDEYSSSLEATYYSSLLLSSLSLPIPSHSCSFVENFILNPNFNFTSIDQLHHSLNTLKHCSKSSSSSSSSLNPKIFEKMNEFINENSNEVISSNTDRIKLIDSLLIIKSLGYENGFNKFILSKNLNFISKNFKSLNLESLYFLMNNLNFISNHNNNLNSFFTFVGIFLILTAIPVSFKNSLSNPSLLKEKERNEFLNFLMVSSLFAIGVSVLSVLDVFGFVRVLSLIVYSVYVGNVVYYYIESDFLYNGDYMPFLIGSFNLFFATGTLVFINLNFVHDLFDANGGSGSGSAIGVWIVVLVLEGVVSGIVSGLSAYSSRISKMGVYYRGGVIGWILSTGALLAFTSSSSGSSSSGSDNGGLGGGIGGFAMSSLIVTVVGSLVGAYYYWEVIESGSSSSSSSSSSSGTNAEVKNKQVKKNVEDATAAADERDSTSTTSS